MMGFMLVWCPKIFASTVPPNIPYVKAWCCSGPEYGVFDLTGNWQGVNPHNPTPSLFPGQNFFYEDTGSTGRSLLNIFLTSQQVFPPAVGGGQQVIQTYQGTMVQTWYESPNNTGACLPTPQITRNMCEFVRRVANYDIEFSLLWCKALDGFYLAALISTDINLTFTDSGLSIPERMVIYPLAGDFCPTIPVAGSPVTYDRNGDLLVSLTPGGQVYLGEGAPHPYDELVFTFGLRDDCWCENGGNNVPKFSMMKRIGSADFADLRGNIDFTVSSDLPLDLVETPFHPSGQFNLMHQRSEIRARMPLESDEDWNTYLDSVKDQLFYAASAPDFNAGQFTFTELPQFDVLKIGDREVLRPARYSMLFRGLNVEEYVTGSNPLVTQFTLFSGADEFNIQTGENIPLTVTPLDGIPIKKNLISELGLMSPANYFGPENLALLHVNNLEAGSPSPAQLEGLKRAILAERVIRDGGRFANAQIKAMLDGLNAILGYIIDEVFSNKGTSKKLKEKRKILDQLNSELEPSNLSSDGWGSVPVDKEAIKSSIDHLLNQNFNLKLSVAAKQLKSWTSTALARLKFVLVAAGFSESDAANISKTVTLAVNTIFDVFIEQGLKAGKAVAKEALKQAVLSAQDDLFESLPFSYTSLTLDAATYSQQQLENWATDNDALFRTDRHLAEGELIQMGIDAYGVLGWASALNITSSGFSDAESTVGPLSKIPVFSKAKAIARLGKYLTGAASFAIPLKGAFLDMPERVHAGVAKAFGEQPAIAFPAAAAGPESPAGTLPNGLGNAVVNPVKATLNQIRSMSSSLETTWNNNSVGSLLDLAAGDEPGDLSGLISKLESEMADLIAMGGAFQGDSITAIQMQDSFVAASINFEQQLAEISAKQLLLLLQVLQREFSGPTDPVYLARRAQILDDLDTVDSTANALRFIADEYRSVMLSQPFGSAVVVNDIALSSNSTAGDSVTQANEVFTLTVRIRNLGASAVTGVEAELLLPSGVPANIQDAAVKAAGSGNLATNDNVTGSGADEAVLSWQVQYTGSLDDEVKVPLRVVSRSTTVDDPGVYGESLIVMFVDPLVSDPDEDGMPTAWEISNGLNAGVDDSAADADSDDLSNEEEYDRGTLAQVADSDADGLDDGDEVFGVNGWVTDPADDDTDDDGTLDGSDGSPLDPTTADSSAVFEPVVVASTNLVVLDEDTPQAQIEISNGGSGKLIWTVESENTAMVIAGSPRQALQTGYRFTVQLAAGLDIAASEGTTVNVIVRDVAGAVRDEQVILVSIGAPPEPPENIFEDGFESP
jgi:hypothetical protein